MGVTITNTETDVVIFPHGPYEAERVTEADYPTWYTPRDDIVLVKITPSMRPGMPYDLSSYPAGWVS